MRTILSLTYNHNAPLATARPMQVTEPESNTGTSKAQWLTSEIEQNRSS